MKLQNLMLLQIRQHRRHQHKDCHWVHLHHLQQLSIQLWELLALQVKHLKTQTTQRY